MGLRIHEKKIGANHATCLQRPPQNCYSTSGGPCIRRSLKVQFIKLTVALNDISRIQNIMADLAEA